MKLLQPIFKELHKKTAELIASFTDNEIQIIERYFTEATTIMRETTNNLNKTKK